MADIFKKSFLHKIFNLLNPGIHEKATHTYCYLQLKASGLFKYVGPFSGYQKLQGKVTTKVHERFLVLTRNNKSTAKTSGNIVLVYLLLTWRRLELSAGLLSCSQGHKVFFSKHIWRKNTKQFVDDLPGNLPRGALSTLSNI